MTTPTLTKLLSFLVHVLFSPLSLSMIQVSPWLWTSASNSFFSLKVRVTRDPQTALLCLPRKRQQTKLIRRQATWLLKAVGLSEGKPGRNHLFRLWPKSCWLQRGLLWLWSSLTKLWPEFFRLRPGLPSLLISAW